MPERLFFVMIQMGLEDAFSILKFYYFMQDVSMLRVVNIIVVKLLFTPMPNLGIIRGEL